MTRLAGLLAALLAVAAIAGAIAGPASAHARLEWSNPADGSSLHGSPAALTLQFDEDVSSALSRVAVVGARTGAVAPLRLSSRGPARLAVALPPLSRDVYHVEWRTVAEDDLHPTSGTLVFGVGSAAFAALSSGGSGSPDGSVAEVGLRWADFTAVALFIGAVATLLFVLPRAGGAAALAREPVVRLGFVGCAAALVNGYGLVILQADRAGGIGGLGSVLTRTTYGRAWIGRELLLALLVCVLFELRRRPFNRGLRAASAVIPLGIVGSMALVSHAAAIRGTASVATAVLALHLLAAAAWVGGVAALCLTIVVLGRAGERAGARAVALAFGQLAVVTVAVLAITGIAVLGIHVRALHDLFATGYGRTLLVKTGLFALAGMLGLSTALGLRLFRAPLRAWAPRLESLVLVALLGAAALLTAQAPARGGAVTPTPAAPRAVTSVSTVRDLVVSIAVEPSRPGPNFVTVRVYNTRRPAPAPIDRVSLTLDGRALQLTRDGETRWRAVTTLRTGGARAAVVVQRRRLPATTATSSWTIVPRPPLPPRVASRTLEPILEPVAIGGAAALLAFLLVVGLSRALRRFTVLAPGPRGR